MPIKGRTRCRLGRIAGANSQMKPNRFYPSRVRFPEQLEEILLRIRLVRFESPVPVLAYLVSLCRRLQPEAIPPDWLDLPLRKLAGVLQEILARQKPISANSVAVYLDDLCYQLRPRTFRVLPEQTPSRELAAYWGASTLRDYLNPDIEANFEALVMLGARAIAGAQLRWHSQKVFAVFTAARWKDVSLHLQSRYGLDKSIAQGLTQETFDRVRRRISKFDPGRAPLIAFTYNEARLVVFEHWKKLRRRNGREANLEGTRDDGSAVERNAGVSTPPELDREREAVKLRLTRSLFRLSKPPHQIIVFILCRLLGVPPRKVLEKYSRLPLRTVARIAEREYLRVSEASSGSVRAGFKKLRARMNRPLTELVRGKKHQAALGSLAGRRAGDIPLGQFFPGANVHAQAREIVEAWNSVKKALSTGVSRWAWVRRNA